MKIKDIITEGHDGERLDHDVAGTGEWKFRDEGGFDRVYNLNRVMMAVSMADGKSSKPVEMDKSSWVEKYNFARPYTEEEHMMLRSALNTVDADYIHSDTDHRSMEHHTTNSVSPMKPQGPIKLKNNKK